MKQLKAKILKNLKVSDGVYRMRIASAYLAKAARPGQFVEVRCSPETDPLLRRPLGIHRVVNGGIELLYEVVGKGTQLLSANKTGEELDIIGPLGNGFDLRNTLYAKRNTIIVAGGNGVAPLLALADRLAAMGDRKAQVFIGAKTKSHILCEKEFKKIGCDVKTSTEDGSSGRKGLITEQLAELLSAKRNTQIYACGPSGMLRAVSEIARQKRIPCQVSLEERMACGVGVCLGCPVKTRGGYVMVCKDGPVFNAEDIVWE